MIDEINFGYSSIHAGRLKQNSSLRSLGKLRAHNGDTFIHSSKKDKSRENLNALMVVSGGFASIGIISDIITRATGLVSGEVSAETAKSMCKTAVLMGGIGAACFGTFKLLEATVMKKICE
ncbi:MAG: hypothetical protein MJ180_01505 [Candidatus Gastranaerophilales bacterium]|nr:hypothetical protein [Candidatus Gastranaerophilales bacterium]